MPNVVLWSIFAFVERKRMTVFSPYTVGISDTRVFISMPLTMVLKCPSCGRRRSAISRLLNIFTRATSELCSEEDSVT